MADEHRATLEHDTANEAVVLRAAIASADVRRSLTRQVSPAEFLGNGHDALWRALKSMADRGLEYTPVAARQLIRAEGGDPALLDVLEAGADVPPNLGWHVEILRWDATRVRIAKETLPRFVELLVDPKAKPDDVSAAARALERATTERGRSHIRRPGELARSYRSEMAARRAGGAHWPTGFAAIDAKMVEGAAPGKTWVVAGLPGSGKSTWICALVKQLVMLDRKVLLAPWEMGSESTLDVLVSHATGVQLDAVVKGNLTDEEADRVLRASDFFSRKVRFMESAFYDQVVREKNRGRPDNERNLDLIEGYVAESGCNVAIFDLWERALVDTRPEAVARALYRMQAMFKLYALLGVIVQQLLLKDVEKRVDKRPTREAIKGTGAYTEVADVIFGVHRDAQFKAVPDQWMELICLKQRKGPVNWAVQFDWRAEVCGISGGEEVPYDPGLEAVMGTGAPGDVAGIRTGGGKKRGRPKGRDES